MPVQDVEMASKAPVARGIPKTKRKRGAYRLPITVAVCFVGLFLFFVILAGHRTSGNSTPPRGKLARMAGAAEGAGGGGALSAERRPDGEPRLFTVKVVQEFLHDAQAFTQGLQFDRVCSSDSSGSDSGKEAEADKCRDVLWESTGLHGHSTVREVELASGKVLRSRPLPKQDFGEGVARHGDRLYQVTWMSGKTWSYAAADFEDVQEAATPLSDGWGITSDGTHLIVGDSSHTLTWVDPAAGMASVRQVAVQDGGTPVPWLNELEYVEGQVWANVWHTDCIAQIEPASGQVVGWVLAPGLARRAAAAAGGQLDREAVLNGIAYDAAGRRIFLTGKLWPRVYQVELEEVEEGRREKQLAEARRLCIQRNVRGRRLHGARHGRVHAQATRSL